MPDEAELVPPDCDLRDFRFMPVEVERLRRSKAWLIAKRQPELGFYMMNLWMAAWHEIPAASLEDDDDVLADAAMCEPRKWAKVRDKVLRGWVKGPGGRIYHPVVAEKARESWAEKQAYRSDKDAELARKHRERKARQEMFEALREVGVTPEWNVTTKQLRKLVTEHSLAVTAPVTDAVTENVTPPVTEAVTAPVTRVTANKGQVRDREGKGQGLIKETPNPAERGFEDKNPRKGGPRSTGINPRALGTNPRAAAANVIHDTPWAKRCSDWVDHNFWQPLWGPKPDEPNCHAPAELVEAARQQREAMAGGAAP